MSYLEELLPEFRKGAKIRQKHWEDGQYIFVHPNGNTYLATGRLFRFETGHLLNDDWERYQEPEPDWDYIIKNKCLCWFWNDDKDAKYLGTIRFINKNYELPFTNWERGCAKHCRPVRRDEVTFYEDKKDDRL